MEESTVLDALRAADRSFNNMRIWNGQGWTYYPPRAREAHNKVLAALGVFIPGTVSGKSD
jgi:hypothetical protein